MEPASATPHGATAPVLPSRSRAVLVRLLLVGAALAGLWILGALLGSQSAHADEAHGSRPAATHLHRHLALPASRLLHGAHRAPTTHSVHRVPTAHDVRRSVGTVERLLGSATLPVGRPVERVVAPAVRRSVAPVVKHLAVPVVRGLAVPVVRHLVVPLAHQVVRPVLDRVARPVVHTVASRVIDHVQRGTAPRDLRRIAQKLVGVSHPSGRPVGTDASGIRDGERSEPLAVPTPIAATDHADLPGDSSAAGPGVGTPRPTPVLPAPAGGCACPSSTCGTNGSEHPGAALPGTASRPDLPRRMRIATTASRPGGASARQPGFSPD